MADDKDYTLKKAFTVQNAIIAALATSLCVVLWNDRGHAWDEITTNSKTTAVALRELADLRLEMATTLATKSDVDRIDQKVIKVIENQQLVALELAKHNLIVEPK